jgi:hypothetical protein
MQACIARGCMTRASTLLVAAASEQRRHAPAGLRCMLLGAETAVMRDTDSHAISSYYRNPVLSSQQSADREGGTRLTAVCKMLHVACCMLPDLEQVEYGFQCTHNRVANCFTIDLRWRNDNGCTRACRAHWGGVLGVCSACNEAQRY